MADSTPGPAVELVAGAAAGGSPAGTAAFDGSRPYRCCPQVALRPEPFGALAYHFGTRRLSFLKTRQLVEVVRTLEAHDDVHAALAAAGVPDPQRAAYLTALAGLAANGTIEERGAR